MKLYFYENLEYLTEDDLLEASAKTDFRDKFGQDALNNFDKAKQRLKNNGLSTDYGQYLKMSEDELNELILSLYDDHKDAQKKRVLQGKDKEIRGKYKHYGIIGGYDVYEPLDYIASMDLGVNTGWCTTGRYGHAGHPEFTPSEKDAKEHFTDYTSEGIRLIYLLDPKTKYGEIAIALYPYQLGLDLIQGLSKINGANFQLFDFNDNEDYSLINKIPKKLVDDLGMILNKEDLSNSPTINKNSIEEIKLLSIDEAKNVPRKILAIQNDFWWLADEAYDSYYPNSIRAAFITGTGKIDSEGLPVDEDRVTVRPALRIHKLPQSEYVQCLGRPWVNIGNNLALSLELLGNHRFDPSTNVYEHSEIKKFLEDWLRKEMAKEG